MLRGILRDGRITSSTVQHRSTDVNTAMAEALRGCFYTKPLQLTESSRGAQYKARHPLNFTNPGYEIRPSQDTQRIIGFRSNESLPRRIP